MLDDIVASVRARLPALEARSDDVRARAESRSGVRSLQDAISTPGLAVIAEVKRRSPSAGAIDPTLDPLRLAAAYQEGGAAAISVLTEPDHFGAEPDDLAGVRSSVDVPVLRKDFIVTPVQIWEARAMGADAVLLIVGILDQPLLQGLLGVADEAGLDALVEVHDDEEARRAADANATLIGVNNRDLVTFRVDLATAERIRPLLPASAALVAESGITGASDAARMASAGFDAVLVGEAAVRSGDPAAFVADLREAAPWPG